VIVELLYISFCKRTPSVRESKRLFFTFRLELHSHGSAPVAELFALEDLFLSPQGLLTFGFKLVVWRVLEF